MKKTIYIIILNLIQLNCNSTFAQPIHDLGNIPFGHCLSKMESHDLINKMITDFDSTIIRFNTGNKKIPVNFNDKWKLAYYIHTGYEEVAGRPRNEISNIYQNIKQEKWLTITEIFTAFQISDTIPNGVYSKESYLDNTFQINSYLDISEKYRGVWTPIITKDNYLIICFFHWYPNGNAHSWLRRYYYYFEKQKL